MKSLRITVGVTGGVAAYKAAELVRLLQQRGADVHVVMTRAAEQFIRPLTFSSLTGHKVITSLWTEASHEESATQPPTSGLNAAGQIEHIAEAQLSDIIVIAPATAHILAKMAHGLADDFLTTLLLASKAPVIVAPAMNVNMWNHPATQANVALLRSRGVHFVDPDAGYLACGMTGSGRLANLDTIVEAVFATAAPSHIQDFAAETVLITAGGTREALDPVRFLGNRSSGKMGYALAEAARQRGAQVILVSAPTALTPPAGCTFVPVISAAEMHAAVMQHLPAASIVIGAAAVADFRLPAASAEKIRRQGPLHLTLEPTEDIVRAVTSARASALTAASHTRTRNAPTLIPDRRDGRISAHAQAIAEAQQETVGPASTTHSPLVIAFAAETDSDIPRARAKLLAKGADAIVLNDISAPGLGFDSDSNAATFITATQAIDLPAAPKRDLADRILGLTLTLRARTLTTA
ncbi:MAG TPA: bifunctional phosphopantothenoylcysteine decarboxylase/phosphopantothenate--cysteine ligase CoaBC [Acidobacteriaceae bacterium]|nr:bifunctional phosphopantothenoylcysteine decarboxylase/phosphopantothenate--cysteine ligase CoaBC [Acidobacteriaceae bacterium]